MEIDHPYPPTKVLWAPANSESSNSKDLVATTGDFLRLWSIKDDNTSICLENLLNTHRTSETCAPLTSADWNSINANLLGTCSIDTTCTIWDLNKPQQPQTQLIAHDAEVFDMAFGHSVNVFASAGADGSVRMFDLRYLDSSTILYESSNLTPLLRVAWNKVDSNYIATVPADSSVPVILDIRVPSAPVAELTAHHASVNAVGWSPASASHVCSVAEDHRALIWDLSAIPKAVDDPVLSYTASAEINNLEWSSVHDQWIALAVDDTAQLVRI